MPSQLPKNLGWLIGALIVAMLSWFLDDLPDLARREQDQVYHRRSLVARLLWAPQAANQGSWEDVRGMNGHIFNIGPTQADRYIKTKKELVGYVGRTYSNLTKKSIENLTYKLTSIVGPSVSTKQVTDPNTNVEIHVDKLEADLAYMEKLDINEETKSYKKEKREYKK